MKTILYMAITINGFVAGENDDTSWVSKESWESYLKTIKSMDAVIIGRNTYDIMPQDEFQPNCIYVVLTHNAPEKAKVTNIIFTDKSPQAILDLLNEKDCRKVCVSGGGQVNAQFLEGNLINEIYVDIEPQILGRGIPLFARNDISQKLRLLEVNRLSENTIQLHYTVERI
jgi:dihydrofolate reductase